MESWITIEVEYKKYRFVVAIFFMLLCLYYVSEPIKNYDTALYHAQSIRWIEEYGVVPGLGNLHHRFAYNNSIFSLQALFSLKFLTGGVSLHNINGFLALIFIGYAVGSLKVFTIHKFYMSDFLRTALISYIISQMKYISSPGSDFFAICMIFYVFIKWVTLLERKIVDSRAYICLCLMSVFAISIKLSAAMLIILTVLPAIRLIREKQWKEIIGYSLLGIVMILPFLIRNIIISGYLIYPYPELNIFNFDWKIPQFTVIFDRNEVKAWGMGVNDFARYNAAFKEWFPIWSKELNKAQLIEVYLFPAMAIISTGFVIRRIFHTKRADYFSVFATMLATIALWFFGAPGLRFGGSFLMLLPCFLLGMFLEILNDKIKMKEFPLIAMTILLIYNSYPILGFLSEYNCNNIIWGSDYEELACEQEKLGTEIIYIPVSGDRTGYYTFPTTPYRTRLNVIELRGDSLRKGFRVKEEYENSLITNYGQIYKE